MKLTRAFLFHRLRDIEVLDVVGAAHKPNTPAIANHHLVHAKVEFQLWINFVSKFFSLSLSRRIIIYFPLQSFACPLTKCVLMRAEYAIRASWLFLLSFRFFGKVFLHEEHIIYGVI